MKSGLLYTGRMRNEEKRGRSPDGVLLTYFCLVVPAVLLNIMMGLNIGKKWQWILVNDWIQGMFSFNNVNVIVVSNSCLQCALISQVSWIKIICTSFQSFLLNGLIWGIKIWLRASPASSQHLFWFNACYCSYQRFWYMNEAEASIDHQPRLHAAVNKGAHQMEPPSSVEAIGVSPFPSRFINRTTKHNPSDGLLLRSRASS